MKKHLVRIIALLLVPCLLADPVTASAFLPSTQISRIAVTPNQKIFEEEAVTAYLIQGWTSLWSDLRFKSANRIRREEGRASEKDRTSSAAAPNSAQAVEAINSIIEHGLLTDPEAQRLGKKRLRGVDSLIEDPSGDISLVGVELSLPEARSKEISVEDYLKKKVVNLAGFPERSPITILGEREATRMVDEIAKNGPQEVEERLRSGVLVLMSTEGTLENTMRGRSVEMYMLGIFQLQGVAPNKIEAIFVPKRLYPAVMTHVPPEWKTKIIQVKDEIVSPDQVRYADPFEIAVKVARGELVLPVQDHFVDTDLAAAKIKRPDWEKALSQYLSTRITEQPRTWMLHGVRFPTPKEAAAAPEGGAPASLAYWIVRAMGIDELTAIRWGRHPLLGYKGEKVLLFPVGLFIGLAGISAPLLALVPFLFALLHLILPLSILSIRMLGPPNKKKAMEITALNREIIAAFPKQLLVLLTYALPVVLPPHHDPRWLLVNLILSVFILKGSMGWHTRTDERFFRQREKEWGILDPQSDFAPRPKAIQNVNDLPYAANLEQAIKMIEEKDGFRYVRLDRRDLTEAEKHTLYELGILLRVEIGLFYPYPTPQSGPAMVLCRGTRGTVPFFAAFGHVLKFHTHPVFSRAYPSVNDLVENLIFGRREIDRAEVAGPEGVTRYAFRNRALLLILPRLAVLLSLKLWRKLAGQTQFEADLLSSNASFSNVPWYYRMLGLECTLTPWSTSITNIPADALLKKEVNGSDNVSWGTIGEVEHRLPDVGLNAQIEKEFKRLKSEGPRRNPEIEYPSLYTYGSRDSVIRKGLERIRWYIPELQERFKASKPPQIFFLDPPNGQRFWWVNGRWSAAHYSTRENKIYLSIPIAYELPESALQAVGLHEYLHHLGLTHEEATTYHRRVNKYVDTWIASQAYLEYHTGQLSSQALGPEGFPGPELPSFKEQIAVFRDWLGKDHIQQAAMLIPTLSIAASGDAERTAALQEAIGRLGLKAKAYEPEHRGEALRTVESLLPYTKDPFVEQAVGLLISAMHLTTYNFNLFEKIQGQLADPSRQRVAAVLVGTMFTAESSRKDNSQRLDPLLQLIAARLPDLHKAETAPSTVKLLSAILTQFGEWGNTEQMQEVMKYLPDLTADLDSPACLSVLAVWVKSIIRYNEWNYNDRALFSPSQVALLSSLQPHIASPYAQRLLRYLARLAELQDSLDDSTADTLVAFLSPLEEYFGSKLEQDPYPVIADNDGGPAQDAALAIARAISRHATPYRAKAFASAVNRMTLNVHTLRLYLDVVEIYLCSGEINKTNTQIRKYRRWIQKHTEVGPRLIGRLAQSLERALHRAPLEDAVKSALVGTVPALQLCSSSLPALEALIAIAEFVAVGGQSKHLKALIQIKPHVEHQAAELAALQEPETRRFKRELTEQDKKAAALNELNRSIDTAVARRSRPQELSEYLKTLPFESAQEGRVSDFVQNVLQRKDVVRCVEAIEKGYSAMRFLQSDLRRYDHESSTPQNASIYESLDRLEEHYTFNWLRDNWQAFGPSLLYFSKRDDAEKVTSLIFGDTHGTWLCAARGAESEQPRPDLATHLAFYQYVLSRYPDQGVNLLESVLSGLRAGQIDASLPKAEWLDIARHRADWVDFTNQLEAGTRVIIEDMIERYQKALGKSADEFEFDLGEVPGIAKVKYGGYVGSGGSMGHGLGLRLTQRLELRLSLAQLEGIWQAHFIEVDLDFLHKYQDDLIRALALVIPHEYAHVLVRERQGERYKIDIPPQIDPTRFGPLLKDSVKHNWKEIIVDKVGWEVATHIYTHSQKFPPGLSHSERVAIGLMNMFAIIKESILDGPASDKPPEQNATVLARFEAQLSHQAVFVPSQRAALMQSTREAHALAMQLLPDRPAQSAYNRLTAAYRNAYIETTVEFKRQENPTPGQDPGSFSEGEADEFAGHEQIPAEENLPALTALAHAASGTALFGNEYLGQVFYSPMAEFIPFLTFDEAWLRDHPGNLETVRRVHRWTWAVGVVGGFMAGMAIVGIPTHDVLDIITHLLFALFTAIFATGVSHGLYNATRPGLDWLLHIELPTLTNKDDPNPDAPEEPPSSPIYAGSGQLAYRNLVVSFNNSESENKVLDVKLNSSDPRAKIISSFGWIEDVWLNRSGDLMVLFWGNDRYLKFDNKYTYTITINRFVDKPKNWENISSKKLAEKYIHPKDQPATTWQEQFPFEGKSTPASPAALASADKPEKTKLEPKGLESIPHGELKSHLMRNTVVIAFAKAIGIEEAAIVETLLHGVSGEAIIAGDIEPDGSIPLVKILRILLRSPWNTKIRRVVFSHPPVNPEALRFHPHLANVQNILIWIEKNDQEDWGIQLEIHPKLRQRWIASTNMLANKQKWKASTIDVRPIIARLESLKELTKVRIVANPPPPNHDLTLSMNGVGILLDLARIHLSLALSAVTGGLVLAMLGRGNLLDIGIAAAGILISHELLQRYGRPLWFKNRDLLKAA